MPTPTPDVIDYRNPRDALLRDRLRAALRRREAQHWFVLIGSFVIGLCLCIFTAELVALALLFAQLRWGFDVAGGWALFFASCAVVIPLFFWLEHRTRGRFFEDAVRAYGLGDNVNALGMLQTTSRGEYEVQTSAASWAAYFEIALFAPRMTMGAVRQWRLRRYLGRFNVPRAAEVVQGLLVASGGVHPRDLLRPNETLGELWPVLLLLALHDWIGISKAADRVWLLSEARERFRGITG